MASESCKFSALKGITEAKKEGKRPNVVLGVGGRRVRNGVEVAVAQEEGLRFGAVEGSSTAAAEDRELVAGLIDGTVAVDTLRNGQSRPPGARRCDKFWRGTRAES